MTKNSHEPIPKLNTFTPHPDRTDWSYERLADCRRVISQAKNSSFLWPHERTHLEEVIDRIDATVSLKRQREEYQKSKKSGSRIAN